MLEKKTNTDIDSEKCLQKCKGIFNVKTCFNYRPISRYLFMIIPLGDICSLYVRYKRQREAYLKRLEQEKYKTSNDCKGITHI